MIPEVSLQVYFVTDRTLRPELPLPDLVRAAAAAGVERVQLREKDLGGRDLLRLAEDVRDACRTAGCRLLVNDRLDVALAAGADGVHLPAAGLPVAAVRESAPAGFLIGASCHSPAEAAAAAVAGADFVVFGPVFPTPGKLRFGPPLGLEPLRQVVDRVRVPVFAIGGIDTETVKHLRGVPDLAGVAVVRALMLSRDPRETVRQLKSGGPENRP